MRAKTNADSHSACHERKCRQGNIQETQRRQGNTNNQQVEKHPLEYQDHMGLKLGSGQALSEQTLQEFTDQIPKNQQQNQQDELTYRILGITNPEKLKTPERRKIIHTSVSHKAA